MLQVKGTFQAPARRRGSPGRWSAKELAKVTRDCLHVHALYIDTRDSAFRSRRGWPGGPNSHSPPGSGPCTRCTPGVGYNARNCGTNSFVAEEARGGIDTGGTITLSNTMLQTTLSVPLSAYARLGRASNPFACISDSELAVTSTRNIVDYVLAPLVAGHDLPVTPSHLPQHVGQTTGQGARHQLFPRFSVARASLFSRTEEHPTAYRHLRRDRPRRSHDQAVTRSTLTGRGTASL